MRRQTAGWGVAAALMLVGPALAMGVMPLQTPATGVIQVQDSGPGPSGGSGGTGEGPGFTPPDTGRQLIGPRQDILTQTNRLSAPATTAITQMINDALARCVSLGAAYQIDCTAAQLKEAAANISPNGEYAPVREALLDASAKLSRIAWRGQDSTQPVLRERNPGAQGTIRYRPVKPATLAQDRAEAVRVLTETQTVLLRSAGNSADRRAHFQRVSAALETGKVLLRS